MSCVLAIETATEACSVALALRGEVRERYEIAPRRHAELVLPMLDELLAEAGVAKSQIDAVAVGRGPGAFTGVRLAVAMAQGLALAWDKPVVPVSTLAVLAMRAPAHETPDTARILALIDARMSEVYAGVFTRDAAGLVRAIDEERLCAPDALTWRAPLWVGVGSGWGAYESALRGSLADAVLRVDAAALPHAADLARLALREFDAGRALPAEQAQPVYLRDKVALTEAERRAASTQQDRGT
jgi:tRNA threonylcarbamoyladenosine biosynthesis protein TsaB